MSVSFQNLCLLQLLHFLYAKQDDDELLPSNY